MLQCATKVTQTLEQVQLVGRVVVVLLLQLLAGAFLVRFGAVQQVRQLRRIRVDVVAGAVELLVLLIEFRVGLMEGVGGEETVIVVKQVEFRVARRCVYHIVHKSVGQRIAVARPGLIRPSAASTIAVQTQSGWRQERRRRLLLCRGGCVDR